MDNRPTCMDAYAGAGGVGLGLERAGFRCMLHIEWDADACATLRTAGLGPVWEGDIRHLTLSPGSTRPNMFWASPPCQPFSNSGNRLGSKDERNGWPWTWELIDRLDAVNAKPTWVVCENVPGLTYHRRKAKCEKGKIPKPDECPGCYWAHEVVPEFKKRFPWVETRKMDAADFGVAQRRSRVFLIAGPKRFPWPKPTHSVDALVWAKWVSETYWKEHGIERLGEPNRTEQRILNRLLAKGKEPKLPRWRTVRDVLDLSVPAVRHQSECRVLPRSIDEASPTVGTKGTLYAEDAERSQLPQSQRTLRLDQPSDTLAAGGSARGSHKAPYVVIEGEDQPGQLRVVGGGGNPHSKDAEHERNFRDLSDEPSLTIAAELVGNRGPWMVGGSELPHDDEPQRTDAMVSHLDRPSQAVSATEHKGTNYNTRGTDLERSPKRATDSVFLGTGRRRLTVAECALLQDFPAEHPFQGGVTSCYRQVGNAVPPVLVEVLA